MSELVWLGVFSTMFCLIGTLEFLLEASSSQSFRTSRWPVNLGFGLVNGAIASLLPIGTVMTAAWAHGHSVGLLNLVSAPFWVTIAVTIMVRTFGTYTYHRLAHAIPALWALHRVHHSDTGMDATTAFRNHPLELIVNGLFLAPLILLSGASITVLLAYEALEALINLLSHSSIPIPRSLDRLLRVVFVTPSVHHLHHSVNQAESASNFSGALSIWDRVFGTFRTEESDRRQQLTFGVEDITLSQSRSFDWLMTSPWEFVVGRMTTSASRPKEVEN